MKERIRHILKEETSIPLVIRRRASFEDIEEAFDNALERMGGSMNNPDSIIYKKKGTTLKEFAKFVIDEMVTYLEQDYFNDDNRIYFDSDEYYYNEIRKPLLKYYEKRIKEKFDEVTSDGLNESFLKEETLKNTLIDIIKNEGIKNVEKYLGGLQNLKDAIDVHNSGVFLNLFSDLQRVESEENPNVFLYRYKKGKNIIVIDERDDDMRNFYAYVNYDIIFGPLSIFRDSVLYSDKVRVLKRWLKNTFDIDSAYMQIDSFHPGSEDFGFWEKLN